MRDVSRMLDAMEIPAEPGTAARQATTPPAAVIPVTSMVAPPSQATPEHVHLPLTTWAAICAAAAGITGVLALAWHRRRRRPGKSTPAAISIAPAFAPAEAGLPSGPDTPKEDAPMARNPNPPDWTYKRTAFETPSLQLTLEPVDLLSRPRMPVEDVSPSLITRLHAPGIPPTLYLSGDRFHPSIRHVGGHGDDFIAWEAIVRATLDAPGDDGQLARWLLPPLLCLRAPYLARKDALASLAEAVSLCRAMLDKNSGEGLTWWRAHLLRAELARLTRSSGATRLLALRNLGSDADDDDVPALDAWVDVHLAWSTWLVGVAAKERLGLADQICTRLARIAPAHAARRRAEVMMRRASLGKGEARLADLDHAMSLLHAASGEVDDPATLLLFADCAHRRAPLLPHDEALEACSFALANAFAAGQHAAWHIASLEMRIALQHTHDTLAGTAPPGDIAATLRRELADARSLLRTGSP
ncbi:hypothetical protein [Luteibacter aegosomatissinici]|uniref:hypothetical protein n=1 Tax=Luteibacter aegosomatissinici TaxID=2911539 RepID=UPI001FFA8908|nr:hypothetical protein [Luteibacter aegosomatissinici]UPG96153.1 hypothetical protein L2Y97_08600 [Luteibacter aegosomatissinici]